MSNAGAPDSLEVHRDSAVQTPALAAWRRVSTVHLFMLLPWIGIVVAARQPIRDNSFLWHIRAGDLQVEAGRVLTVDPFSSTFAGKPWRTQAWLADLLYSWLHTIAGLSFVPWLIALASLVAVSYVGLAAARASTSGVAAAVLITMVAWIGVGFLSPRPVLFSYALLAALAVILERPRLRWSIPLLLWLWASLHGSFIVGLGLIVLTALARKRRFGRDLGAAVVAVSVTAHGLGTWMTLIRFAQNRSALDLITEWAPPRLASPDLLPYVALIVLIMWGISTAAISQRELFVVVPFLIFGLTAERSLFPAVIVLAPYAAKAIGTRLDGRIGRGGVHGAVNVAVALIIVALPFLLRPEWQGLSASRFPIAEAAELTGAPVFHDDVVGGYLIYARPDVEVFVDDRAELYGADHFLDVIATRNARPVWVDVFERNGFDQALLDIDDGLVAVLELSGWQRRIEGESFVLLVRPDA